MIWCLIRDEEAVTAVEYAVMLALIIVSLVITVSFVGFNTAFTFTQAAAGLEDSSGGFDAAGDPL